MPRRLLRLALTFLSALSLLLCAVSAALWVQSYRQRYSITYSRVDERPTEWVRTSRIVSLEPSSIYFEHDTESPLSKSDVLPGPQGEVRIIVRDRPPTGFKWQAEAPGPRWDLVFGRPYLRWRLVRFAWIASDTPKLGGSSFRLMVIPLYGIVLTTAVLPIIWMRGRLRQRQAARRAAAGFCPRCGYDLRASPGRCPECGAISEGAVQPADKSPLNDHTPSPKGLPAWAQWVLASALVAVAVAVLAAALLPLSLLVPRAPDVPSSSTLGPPPPLP